MANFFLLAFRYLATDNLIEKSIILLNYCIDDIEKFTAHVQAHARDLAQKYSPDQAFFMKKEHFQATQFTSVFQKFKLAFNLLVRDQPFFDVDTRETKICLWKIGQSNESIFFDHCQVFNIANNVQLLS